MDDDLFAKAVYFVGTAFILSVLGIIIITVTTDKSIPDVLQNISVGSMTGLIGLLVQKRSGR